MDNENKWEYDYSSEHSQTGQHQRNCTAGDIAVFPAALFGRLLGASLCGLIPGAFRRRHRAAIAAAVRVGLGGGLCGLAVGTCRIGGVHAGGANRSEAPTHENATVCQGLSY